MAEAPAAGKEVVPMPVSVPDEVMLKEAIWLVVWFSTKKMPLAPPALEVQLPVEVPTSTQTDVVSDEAPVDAPVTVIE
jgi:hypothetical protein